jgi:hypothetical protein
MQTATDYMATEMNEEAPANVTAGVAKFDPLLSRKKKTKVLKRFKDM